MKKKMGKTSKKKITLLRDVLILLFKEILLPNKFFKAKISFKKFEKRNPKSPTFRRIFHTQLLT